MIDLGKWGNLRGTAFAPRNVPSVAGISGGRTSAMMAALLGQSTVLAFENTGVEHPKTYEFVRRLEDALQREIVWLEWRPPPNKGDPPKMFSFEKVTFDTASRKGEPFRGMLESIRDYRNAKGEGAISPWARQRICTTYLKYRVEERYCASLGWEAYDKFIGLRADEPDRVCRIHSRDTQKKSHRCPLAYVGIQKQDVIQFWSRQNFDLEIDEYQGNCTACFLKDQSDISRALGEPETNADWWKELENDFADFGGRNFPGYALLGRETLLREAIREAMATGALLPSEYHGVDSSRIRLVIRQERRRAAGESASVPCACEAASSDDE